MVVAEGLEEECGESMANPSRGERIHFSTNRRMSSKEPYEALPPAAATRTEAEEPLFVFFCEKAPQSFSAKGSFEFIS